MFLSPTEPIDDVLNQALIEKAEKHPLVHKAQVKKLDAEVINAQKHETYLKIKKEFAEDVEYMVQNLEYNRPVDDRFHKTRR